MGNPQLGRPHPIDIDLQAGVVQHLHDMGIDDARNGLHPLHQLLGQTVGAFEVHILDLHVDRRWQAEIQHLTDDVGGLKIDDAAGKPIRQFRPDSPDVVDRRVVSLLQRDQDFGIHGPDIVTGHERQVKR